MTVESRSERRRLERVLVVEDNAPLRGAIARKLRSMGWRVLEAGTVREARVLVSPPPDLLITDVRLPDAPAFPLLKEVARLWPRPIVVAISGCASPEEAFRLARLGVRAYLEKPISLVRLVEVVESACRDATCEDSTLLDAVVSGCVGQVSLRCVQNDVRHAMIRQALALAEGSRSGAARLLDVSRQAVQQMLRSATDHPFSTPDQRGEETTQDSLRGESDSARE